MEVLKNLFVEPMLHWWLFIICFFIGEVWKAFLKEDKHKYTTFITMGVGAIINTIVFVVNPLMTGVDFILSATAQGIVNGMFASAIYELTKSTGIYGIIKGILGMEKE